VATETGTLLITKEYDPHKFNMLLGFTTIKVCLTLG